MSTTRVTTETVKQRAIRVIAVNLGVKEDQVVPTARFAEDLGADRWDMQETVMGLEEEFDLAIIEADAEKLRTVQDAFNLISTLVE